MDRIREGDIYKIVELDGVTFEIRYGYYGDIERAHCEPMPIYPDFIKNPQYAENGEMFVTADQEVCMYFKSKPKASGEGWCDDCEFFDKREDFLGVCKNGKNKKRLEKQKI